MGLDITFTQRERITCPKCGELAGYRDIRDVDSSGRIWYDLLERFGYYAPHSESDWYGKDMTLTREQVNEAYQYVLQHEPYRCDEVSGLLARAMIEGHDIVINADW